MQTFFGVIAGLALMAFAAFGFWQGFRVKPRRGSNSTSDAISLIRDNNLHQP
jgi:hypothetical protein